MRFLCYELDNTTSLLDLTLGVLAEVSGADNEGDLRETTLSEDLGVSEGKEVENRGRVGGALAGEVLLALLSGDEGPELKRVLVAVVLSKTIETRQTLSRLMTGFQNWFCSLWK